MSPRRAFAVCLAIAAAAPLACAERDVVIAELPDAVDASDAPPGLACTASSGCPPAAYCAKNACGDPSGGCQVRPLLCGGEGPPVCGCDGVTYWNDCLRRRSGVAAAAPGECAVSAAMCADPMGASCPVPGASCARLLPPMAPCGRDVPGYCWVLPDACPPGGRPQGRWVDCADPMTCRDTCSAIGSGVPHHGPGPGDCR